MDYSIFHEDLRDLLLFNEVILKPFQHESISTLPTMSFRTLCILMLHDGLTLNELAKLLCVSKQRCSVLVKRLEEDSYVTYKQDEKDKRKMRIYINEEASNMINDQLESYAMILEDLMKKAPNKKQVKLLKKVHELHLCIKECEEDL